MKSGNSCYKRMHYLEKLEKRHTVLKQQIVIKGAEEGANEYENMFSVQ